MESMTGSGNITTFGHMLTGTPLSKVGNLRSRTGIGYLIIKVNGSMRKQLERSRGLNFLKLVFKFFLLL
jgi:hypothetical protein